MRILKNIWAQLHRFVFWAILIALFWMAVYYAAISGSNAFLYFSF